MDCKEIQPIHPKGNQSWVFIGRTDAEAKTPIFWPPDSKTWLIWKDPDAGRDWGQEEKGTTEDEMAGWHHRLDGDESEWTPGVGDGQGGLACCDSWGCKESDTTEWLNWTELNWTIFGSFAHMISYNHIVTPSTPTPTPVLPLLPPLSPWVTTNLFCESALFSFNSKVHFNYEPDPLSGDVSLHLEGLHNN